MKSVILALVSVASIAHAEPGDSNTVVLYQVGSNGKYCVSYTLSEKGCISGTDDGGAAFNTLNFAKGKKVVFKNVSDAPHDMRFTGANAEDIPAQDPNGADAVKKIRVEDQNKEKITCSFHGNQLAVGYRVPGATSDEGSGHKDPTGQPREAGARSGGDPFAKVQKTGLADVANEVLAKGRPADVSKLVQNRPELMAALNDVRPLLAQELKSQGIGGAAAAVAQTAVGSSLGGGTMAKIVGGGAGKAEALIAGAAAGAKGPVGAAGGLSAAEALAVLSSNTTGTQTAAATKGPRAKKADDDEDDDDEDEDGITIARKRALASAGGGILEDARTAAEEAAALRAGMGMGAEGRGPASLRDRTKMRLVRGEMGGDDSPLGFFGLDHRVMIVLLLATVWMIFSLVMAGTKRRKKRQEEAAERAA